MWPQAEIYGFAKVVTRRLILGVGLGVAERVVAGAYGSRRLAKRRFFYNADL